MIELRWESVLAWRMRRQDLTRRSSEPALLQVTAAIAGAHAQGDVVRRADPCGRASSRSRPTRSSGRCWPPTSTSWPMPRRPASPGCCPRPITTSWRRPATPTRLPGADRARVYRPQGWLSPVVVVDGRIAGAWSHELGRDRLEVRVEPFGRATRAERAGVEAEAERLTAFLGGSPALEWASA